jgi:hypothetical protein
MKIKVNFNNLSKIQIADENINTVKYFFKSCLYIYLNIHSNIQAMFKIFIFRAWLKISACINLIFTFGYCYSLLLVKTFSNLRIQIPSLLKAT